MTFTYDPDSLSTELYRLRLELADTDSNDYYLTDEEIAQIQSEESSFYARAAKCCVLICSIVAKRVKHSIDGFSEDSGVLYERYRKMALRYARLGAGSYPWMSSISASSKEAYELDTDLVDPKFGMGMHDNN